MEKIIVYSIIGVVVTLLVNYLNKKANSKLVTADEGAFNLRLHKLYWHIGISSIVLGVLGFVLLGLTVEDQNGWLIGLFFLFLFGGLGLICAVWYANHKFSFDSIRIESVSVYGKKTSIEWYDIKNVKFNALSGLLVFTDSKGLKVKAHQHLVGFGEILTSMEKNTNWKTKDLKLPRKQ